MEKYCKSCGAVFNDLKFKLCPYCGGELDTRYGRQPIPRKLRHEVFKRDGYRCRECGSSKDETSLEIDHIVPVAKGGTNDIDNLQTLCRECNRMKHTDTWVGGETSNELHNKIEHNNDKIKEFREKLDSTTSEKEKIDFKYQIMKIQENNEFLEEKLKNCLNKEKENSDTRKKIKEREEIFKRLYVTINEEDISHLNEVLYKSRASKEQIIDFYTDMGHLDMSKKGHEYEKSKEYEKAIECFNEATKISKTDYIWIFKGQCHFKLQQFDEALKCFKKATQINEFSFFAWFKEAETYGMLENYEEMIKCYDKTLQLNPNFEEALMGKGDYYLKNRKKELAEKCYSKVLQINPKNEDAKFALKNLNAEKL